MIISGSGGEAEPKVKESIIYHMTQNIVSQGFVDLSFKRVWPDAEISVRALSSTLRMCQQGMPTLLPDVIRLLPEGSRKFDVLKGRLELLMLNRENELPVKDRDVIAAKIKAGSYTGEQTQELLGVLLHRDRSTDE